MADIWPIENAWTYIEEILEEEFENLTLLKQNNLEYNQPLDAFQMDKFNIDTTTIFDEEKKDI